MKKGKKRYANSEDDFLDCMVKLAFDQVDLEKTQAIMEAAEKRTSEPDAERVRRAWQAAFRKVDCLISEETSFCPEDLQ